MICAPRSMLNSAASAIMGASVPAICTAMGATSPSWLARREVFRLCHKSRLEVTISLTA
jgi:DNA-binding IclR family transcriptional regulator